MTDRSVKFFEFEEANPLIPLPGIEMRGVYGEAGSVNLVRLDPDTTLPLHSHPHEQIGLVLEGVQILIVDGQEHHVHPLQSYVIPSGVEHAGRGGPSGCLAIDIFIPVREDYRAGAAPERSTPAERRA